MSETRDQKCPFACALTHTQQLSSFSWIVHERARVRVLAWWRGPCFSSTTRLLQSFFFHSDTRTHLEEIHTLMTDFDSIVPHELFKFLANAETNAGELAQYAVRLARHEVSLEVLRAKESSEAKELLQAAGMVDEMHLQCMLGKLHEPDARFALEKKVAVSSLR